ncbi:MAG: hypothetical protein BWK79_09875 [Beggiatoa sp. IS2]|nr:MAG: hypothetical protein BWK79_09875 [Beggiatoa sp. IS2]
MDLYQLTEFMGHHPLLFTALFVVLGLLLWDLVNAQLYGAESLLPHEATLLINREDAIVLDVREDSEYKQGSILNAVHIPLSHLANSLNRLEKYRNRPIIASCLSGNRSVRACATLKKHGFEKIYNLKGGIYAWQNASLPLTKTKD